MKKGLKTVLFVILTGALLLISWELLFIHPDKNTDVVNVSPSLVTEAVVAISEVPKPVEVSISVSKNEEEDPCAQNFITQEVAIQELRLKELKDLGNKIELMDFDQDDFNLEDYTDLTYPLSFVEFNRKKTRTKKEFVEILNYFYYHEQVNSYRKLYVPEYFREDKAIPYSEKLYKAVIENPEMVATQAAIFLKTIPNGRELAKEWGQKFIEDYRDMPWNASVGIVQKRTTTYLLGQHGRYCKTVSEIEVLQNPHPAKRDASGRFINEALASCIPDNRFSSGGKLCPVVHFQNHDYEDKIAYLWKQVWRAGPKFYANMVIIIRLVWQELGIKDPTIQ